MIYNSRKGVYILVMIAIIFTLTIVSSYGKIYAVTTLLLLANTYIVWMWFDTYYKVTDTQLLYKCALLKGSIDISTIVEIVKNKTMYSGIKASLSTKGLIIKYNKWDDVYISPKEADQLIDALKVINPNIKVVE